MLYHSLRLTLDLHTEVFGSAGVTFVSNSMIYQWISKSWITSFFCRNTTNISCILYTSRITTGGYD